MRLRLPGFITKDILAMAFDSIRAHKFRSTLTVLGIIIGVMTVIVVAVLLMGLRGNTEAVSANYAEVVNVHLKEGRFINEQDDVYRRNVVVLGVNAAEALFPDQPNNIVGTHVKMGGYVWEVIGVLDKRKSTFLGE